MAQTDDSRKKSRFPWLIILRLSVIRAALAVPTLYSLGWAALYFYPDHYLAAEVGAWLHFEELGYNLVFVLVAFSVTFVIFAIIGLVCLTIYGCWRWIREHTRLSQ